MREPGDVAIIGMSATFAGAPDVATYWSNILDKVDAIREAPPDWIGDDTIFDPRCTPESVNIYTNHGGFLGDLARFDPRPFGTMPAAIAGSEPDQFLALKASYGALADAGYADQDFDRERTGIILGHGIHAHRANVNGIQHALVIAQTMSLLRAIFPDLPHDRRLEVETMLRSKLPAFNVDSLPGLVPNMMTGRIANRLDLMGPNYIIDGGCASSLLAIQSAITELNVGRADMMLAGGVNTSTSPLVYVVFCKIGALSRRCMVRPFDKFADGTLLGEGQGVVVLKRLDDALRAGDRIYAVIKGTGSASDGRAMGLMTPRLEGEVLAMQRAYVSSGVDPSSIGLVEAHGTGIPLGDEIEIRALTSVLGERRGVTPHVAIGSVKSMIGHCIPAAGMASLIKVAMALEQKILPPTLAEANNPALGLERTPFFLNTDPLPWIQRSGAPRRAAIDAFGFGGINTHMILEEAPAIGAAAAFGLRSQSSPELFALAAETREELVAAARSLTEQASARLGRPLRALAADSIRHLGTGPFRLAVVAGDPAGLRDKLRGVLDKLASSDTHRLRSRRGVFFSDDPIGGKLAFVFPGENSQYPGMLRELALSSPPVRERFDQLEGLFQDERETSHRFLLYPPALAFSDAEKRELEARLREVDCGSEAVFFADMAIFTLLRALGLRPDFMVGHSTGENAAIVAAGLVKGSSDDLRRYIRQMNAIFRDLQQRQVVPHGTLLTVGAVERGALDQLLMEHDNVHLTMDNCPNQVILFGPTPQMTHIGAQLSAKGAICIALPISWAYHTPFVSPMADAFAAVFRDEDFGSPSARLYSCASAGPFPDALSDIRELLHCQYVSCVGFRETIRRLYDDGARIFVEVGPAGVLTGFIDNILRDRPHLALATDSKRVAGFEQMLTVLGQLFVNRVPLDLSSLFDERGGGRAEDDNAPVLRSAVPFIHIGPEEAARVREILLGGQTAGHPLPRGPEPEDYVGSEGRAFGSPGNGSPPAFEPPDADALPVIGWPGCLELPFAAAIEFVSLDWPSQASLTAHQLGHHLGDRDRRHFDAEISLLGVTRQQEWLAGRIAARRAASAWLSVAHNGPAQAEPEIGYSAEGRPILLDGSLADTVFLSISHKDTIAVAAATDRQVGIDLERFTAVRDPAGITRVAFSAREAALLAQVGWNDSQLVAIAWSAKEAAAKALGQKLLGRERLLAITALDPARSFIRLAHAGGWIDAFYALDGDFVCTLAALAAGAVA